MDLLQHQYFNFTSFPINTWPYHNILSKEIMLIANLIALLAQICHLASESNNLNPFSAIVAVSLMAITIWNAPAIRLSVN